MGDFTRKWMARTVVAIGGLATMFLTTGTWDTEESLMAVTIVVGAITSLLVPNEAGNSGVPSEKR